MVCICSHLHGKVGDECSGGDVELKDPLSSSRVSVEHATRHRSEGIAGNDGGLDRQLLNVRFNFLEQVMTIINITLIFLNSSSENMCDVAMWFA